MDKLEVYARTERKVTIYGLNGFQCKGTIVDYDRNFVSIMNERTGEEEIIMMHAISTIR